MVLINNIHIKCIHSAHHSLSIHTDTQRGAAIRCDHYTLLGVCPPPRNERTHAAIQMSSASACTVLLAGAVAGVVTMVRRRRAAEPPPAVTTPAGAESRTAGDDACSAGRDTPDYYVIINNVAKRQNVGTMMRSCAAFGCKQMLVVGTKKKTSFFGNFGTKRFVEVVYFDTLVAACNYARGRGCVVCGIEIDDQARSVVGHPFRGSTAFIMGNEGDGMHDSEKALCDHFVYIPHHGNGTASLNVTVASSIIFHHFSTWAGYPERVREGQKFVVSQPATKTPDEHAQAGHNTRERRRQQAAAAAAAAADTDVGSLLDGLVQSQTQEADY